MPLRIEDRQVPRGAPVAARWHSRSGVEPDGHPAAAGQVFLWPGGALYLGPILDNDTHAHHAVQVSIALRGTLSLQAPPDPRWKRYRSVVTAPDQLHRLRCAGPVAQLYLDPESTAGRALREHLDGAAARAIALDEPENVIHTLNRAAEGEPGSAPLRAVEYLTGYGTPALPRHPIDPRVQQILTAVRALPGRHATLAALAPQVFLSPSRLAALFRRDIGIPLRRYLLWLRLIDAVETLAAGADLTRAAHDVGFADSAHLSRTFRQMFGMPPTALHSQRVVIHVLAPGSAEVRGQAPDGRVVEPADSHRPR